MNKCVFVVWLAAVGCIVSNEDPHDVDDAGVDPQPDSAPAPEPEPRIDPHCAYPLREIEDNEQLRMVTLFAMQPTIAYVCADSDNYLGPTELRYRELGTAAVALDPCLAFPVAQESLVTLQVFGPLNSFALLADETTCAALVEVERL